MGVMFPGAIVHQGQTAGTGLGSTSFSWNANTTLSSIQDGLSNTILLGESTTAGYAAPGTSIFRHRDELGLPAPVLHLVHGV